MAQTYYDIRRFISLVDRLPAATYEGQIRRRSKPPCRRKEMKRRQSEWYWGGRCLFRTFEGIQVGGWASRSLKINAQRELAAQHCMHLPKNYARLIMPFQLG